MSIGKFAKKVGVTTTTLRTMDREGVLVPHHVTAGGTRYYSSEQLKDFGLSEEKNKEIVVGYCRVCSERQKKDLEKQVENLKTYMLAKGYQFEMIADIGNAYNYNKKGLAKLIKMVADKDVNKVVVMNRDTLVGDNFELMKTMFKAGNVDIELIDRTK